MTTQREWTADVLEAVEYLAGELPDLERDPFLTTVATAHQHAVEFAAAEGSPALVWPMVVTLLAYASTSTASPTLATALVDATRAHATAYVREGQVRAFVVQLDADA